MTTSCRDRQPAWQHVGSATAAPSVTLWRRLTPKWCRPFITSPRLGRIWRPTFASRFSSSSDGKHRLNNGAVYRIKSFDRAGNIILENKWVLAKNFGHIAYGVVATSHAEVEIGIEISMPISTEGAKGAARRVATAAKAEPGITRRLSRRVPKTNKDQGRRSCRRCNGLS